MNQPSESIPPFPPPAGARQPLQVVPPLIQASHAGEARIRALEAELAATQAELQQLQELLSELPGIFERKFQQRLEPVLQQQHQLQEENAGLRDQMRQLPPAASTDSREWQKPSLLMPSLPQRNAIEMARRRRNSDPA